jgi:hypothetical protein
MWIICKLEKRTLDADYFQVGKEGHGCGLFASWKRGPWMRIIFKWEMRVLDADYLQEGFGRELFAKCRKGHECSVVSAWDKRIKIRILQSGKRAPYVDFSLTRIGP